MHVIPNFQNIYLTDSADRPVKVIAWSQSVNNDKIVLTPIVWNEMLQEGVEFFHNRTYTREPQNVHTGITVTYDAA